MVVSVAKRTGNHLQLSQKFTKTSIRVKVVMYLGIKMTLNKIRNLNQSKSDNLSVK